MKYAYFNNKSFTNSVEICLILIICKTYTILTKYLTKKSSIYTLSSDTTIIDFERIDFSEQHGIEGKARDAKCIKKLISKYFISTRSLINILKKINH